ncbi:MAG: hypothetical protein QM737_12760 [Ferruginibacter sp.]
MNTLDFFKSDILTLPKKHDGVNFILYVEDLYNKFLFEVDKINEGTIVDRIDQLKNTLKEFCDKILLSLKTYYQGFPAKAYFIFEEAINETQDFFLPKGSVTESFNIPFFRARTGKNFPYERHQMFHLPFDMREEVTTQRFSVPGLPCLYLSNCSYVCWEELGRPLISEMQVSRFKLEKKTFKWLDISLTPNTQAFMMEVLSSEQGTKLSGKDLQTTIDDHDAVNMTLIMRWPLLAACSIVVAKKEGKFKPEYIFPQFLLQWVCHSKKADGIKYYSIECKSLLEPYHAKLINYAVPVKTIGYKGYCPELVSTFSLTQPVSWELLQAVNPKVIDHDHEKYKSVVYELGLDTAMFYLQLIKGKQTLYTHSTFGKIDIELSSMEYAQINT